MPEMTSGTVELPGIGKVKKSYALAGGAAALIILIIYIRQRQAAQAANAASTDATASDATAADIDPATGFPYGSPQDEQALQAQDTLTGGTGFGGGGGDTTNPAPTGFTTNGQWAQAAEQFMLNTDPSVNADSIAAALGKYIAGSPVTSDQQTIIQEAIAFEGSPPVNGSNGYPPSINVQSVTTPPPPTTVKVPNLIGDRKDEAQASLRSLGLQVRSSGATNPTAVYYVHSQSPRAGTSVKTNSIVTITVTTKP